MKKALSVVFFAAISVLLLAFPGQAVAIDVSEEFAAIQDQVRKARDRVLPALVRVQPITEEFSGGRKINRTGFGSGVIIGPEGYVMTNYHVAGKAVTCICIMSNKEEVPAKLVGADPWTDIAIIQLDLSRFTGNTLTWATLGDSDRVQEGDFVLAMGSPFSLTRSVTFGIVSCRDRSLGVMGIDGEQQTGQFSTWLQIDALINPGNSGGPLVDMEGRVIGINTRGGMGMGFSVPVNVASEVARQIISTGKVTRSWIGITFQPIEKFKRNFLGDIAKGGVLVANVDEESPAAKAGIKPGDIVIRIGDAKVSARFEEEIYPVAKMVADLKVGSQIEVEYVRKKVKATVSLSTEALESLTGDEAEFKDWGFTAKEITRALAREMRLSSREGLLVTGAVRGSVIEKAKIGGGDIIIEVDGNPVRGLKDFAELLPKLMEAGKEKLFVRVVSGGRTPKMMVVDQSSALKAKKENAGAKEGDKGSEEY